MSMEREPGAYTRPGHESYSAYDRPMASAPTDKSIMEERLNSLDAEIEQLNYTLTDLVKRLDPVISPTKTTDQIEGRENAHKAPAYGIVAGRVVSAEYKICELRKRIVALLQTLEV